MAFGVVPLRPLRLFETIETAKRFILVAVLFYPSYHSIRRRRRARRSLATSLPLKREAWRDCRYIIN